MTKTKKIIVKLACAAVLGTAGVALTQVATPQVTVNAATTSVAARALGVDVASYQNADLSSHANAGAQFAIVKVSEGTSYRNPKASSQISTALSNNMMPMAYHFATFSASTSAAVAEANYAVKAAEAFGLPKGSYIACDYETGQGNNIYGGKTPTANAIIAFMDQIKAAGYKPLLYASSSVLQNQIDTDSVLAKYPNSLWVASYAISGRIDNPNFNYFPSMEGVSIWQFTDNWRGLSVDGNVAVLPLTLDGDVSSNNGAISQAPSNSSSTTKTEAATTTTNKSETTSSSSDNHSDEPATSGYVMKKAYIYNKKGERQSGYYAAYHGITYYGSTVTLDNGKTAIRVGDDRYVMASNVLGNSRVMRHNAYIYNHAGRRANWRILRKGTPIKTYGSRFYLNGKSYYRIGKGLYAKCANF